MDNIAHNPSSTTTKDSFHGTGISLFQDATTSQVSGEQRISVVYLDNQSVSKITQSLPDSYVSIQPAVLKSKAPKIPRKKVRSLDVLNIYLKHSKRNIDGFRW